MAAWPFMSRLNQIVRKVYDVTPTSRSEELGVPPEKKARLEAGSCPSHGFGVLKRVLGLPLTK